jgi:hypothetical protein
VITLYGPSMVSDNAVIIIEKTGKISFYSLMDLRPILETKNYDISNYLSGFEYESYNINQI